MDEINVYILMIFFLDEILSIWMKLLSLFNQIAACMDETMFMDEIDDIGN
jgi:hypothetical protein